MPEAPDKKIAPTIVVTKNAALKTFSHSWTLRKVLKTHVPDVAYEARSLRKSCEWEFAVTSDVAEFLAALQQMKLEYEVQENVVDIHIRNLPWG